MGHQRTGNLPRSKKWNEIVSNIGKLSKIDPKVVHKIAGLTIEASSQGLKRIPEEPSVQKSFQFLIALSIAGKSEEFKESASALGIEVKGEFTKLELSKALRAWLEKTKGYDDNTEFASLARYATTDTIAEWINKSQEEAQLSLFPSEDKSFSPWRHAADGRGFCELSRIFFSNFTTRYIQYFLSRTASSSLTKIKHREEFSKEIKNHIEQISHHAFETSKIVQSFSAGWFNKNTRSGIPTKKKIKGFLNHSFSKIREELRREKEVK